MKVEKSVRIQEPTIIEATEETPKMLRPPKIKKEVTIHEAMIAKALTKPKEPEPKAKK